MATQTKTRRTSDAGAKLTAQERELLKLFRERLASDERRNLVDHLTAGFWKRCDGPVSTEALRKLMPTAKAIEVVLREVRELAVDVEAKAQVLHEELDDLAYPAWRGRVAMTEADVAEQAAARRKGA